MSPPEQNHEAPLHITALPFDILCAIVSFIHPIDIAYLRLTCRTFSRLLKDPIVLAPLLRNLVAPEDEKHDDGRSTFDSYLRRFHNRRRGKPTSTWVLHDMDPFRADQAEASYDHRYFAYYADVGLQNKSTTSNGNVGYETFTESAPNTDICIVSCANRHNKNPLARVRVSDLDLSFCMRWLDYAPTLSIDYRTLVATGIGTNLLRAVGIWSVHDFPNIKLLRWWWQPDCSSLYYVTSNDNFIAYSDRRAKAVLLVDLKLDKSGNPIGDAHWDGGQYKNSITEIRLDAWSADKKGIRDIHLSKSHLFVFSRVEDSCRFDIFKIDPDEEYLSQFDIMPQRVGKNVYHVKKALIHSWSTMFASYISHDEDPEDTLNARRNRLDKISPSYTGRIINGDPEEEDDSCILTLSRSIDGSGCIPLGSIRISVRDDSSNGQGMLAQQPEGTSTNSGVPIVTPDCIIPSFVAIGEKEFQEEKTRSFIVKNADDKLHSVPDEYREWDLIHDSCLRNRSMRVSLPIKHEGLCTAVFDDATFATPTKEGALSTATTSIEVRNEDNELGPLPTMLTQKHLVRTTISEIIKLPKRHFHTRAAWFGGSPIPGGDTVNGDSGSPSSSAMSGDVASTEINSPSAGIESHMSERFAQLKEYRTQSFIATGLGYSSYAWQGDDWYGFLCLELKPEGSEDSRYERKTFLHSARVKMLILRYD